MRKIFAGLCMLLILGQACASIPVRMDDGAVLLDDNGAEIISFGAYDDIVSLNESLLAAAKGGKYALLNADGTALTDHGYEHILVKGGLLLAKKDKLWGVLDPDGSVRFESEYSLIVPDGKGGAWAIRGENGDIESDEVFLLTADGTVKSTGIFSRFMDSESGNGLLAVLMAEDRLYGYMDVGGKLKLPAEYKTAAAFSAGVAVVSVNRLSGVIDTSGSFILPAEYNFVSATGAAILAVNDEGAYLFDLQGKELLAHPGKNISAAFAGEHPLIYDGEEMYLYTPDGSLLETLSADAFVYEGLPAKDGVQLIISDGAWGEECVRIMGTENARQNIHPLGFAGGEPLYAFMRVNVARYMNNLLDEAQLSADMDTAHYGVLDARGNILLPANYAAIHYLADDRLLVKTDVQWRVIDTGGRIYWRRNITPVSQE